MKLALPPKLEIDEIMQMLFSDLLRDNPLAYVLYAFPWGQKNTPLEHFDGPREWQKKELLLIAEHIKENKKRVAEGKEPTVYKLAVSSGRGIGKSTLVSWVVLWMISCHYGSTTIVTANTDAQLTDKTFGEIGRWLTMSINRFFFETTQKSIKAAPWYEKLLKEQLRIDTNYYYANGVLWSAESPEAFAGAHSQVGILLLFDESSEIPEPIWTVSRGFFTEPTVYRFWLSFSNPRSGAGAFYDVFQDVENGWNTRQINSLDVEGIDKSELEEIIRKYGSDSDEARVEVYGEFPAHGDKQFISRSLVSEATTRELFGYTNKDEPLLMAIDPARFGSDSTVIRFRCGRDAKSFPVTEMKGQDNMKVVAAAEQLIHSLNPDAIFCDSGAGAGIIDRLRELGYKVFEVRFGSSPFEDRYFDHRTELWGRMAEWLARGQIDDNKKLKADLCNPRKLFIGREAKIKLESKDEMKRRGIKSPDHADALAMTFHAKVAKKSLNTARGTAHKRYRPERGSVFD